MRKNIRSLFERWVILMKVSYNEIYNTIINFIDPGKFGDIKEVIEYLKDSPDQFAEINAVTEEKSFQNITEANRKTLVTFSALGDNLELISKKDESFKNVENVPQFLELLQYMSTETSLDSSKIHKSHVIKY